ncbi:hypothetical protein MCEMIH16_01611 [Caulobacteraceae bacterium]
MRASVVGPLGRRLVATLIVALGCLALGVLAMPEQLRMRLSEQKRSEPHCAPEARSTRCLVWRANVERKRAAFPEAVALSRAALAREPLHLVALETLARSMDPRRTAEKARLITLIAILSKHSAYAHTDLMLKALSQERPDDLMYHADVLLRWGQVDAVSVHENVIQYITDETGRAAVARRLATDPPWRVAFLRSVADKAAPGDALALHATMNRMGVRQTPVEAGLLAARLLQANLFSELRRFRRDALAGRGAASAVFDGDFDGLEGPAPFVWEPLQVSGGEAVLGTAETSHPGALRLEHDLFSSSDWMVRQLVLLPPGRYRLSLAARGLDDQGTGRFVAEVGCRGASSLIRLPIRTAAQGSQVSVGDFTVPADGCAAQWLAFAPVTGDRVEAVQVLIDRISISPSTSPPPAAPLQTRRPANAQ